MSNKRTTPRTCATCGTDFLARPTLVKLGHARFCSKDCIRLPRIAPIPQPDGSMLIPLTGRQNMVIAYAIVDAADAEFVSQWRWHLNPSGYAIRSDGDVKIRMHRALLGLTTSDKIEVDHIDRNTLDNRRMNLRSITHAENMQNMSPQKGRTSAHRGVFWNPDNRNWRARLRHEGKTLYLGSFAHESDAVAAVQTARRRLMPYSVD